MLCAEGKSSKTLVGLLFKDSAIRLKENYLKINLQAWNFHVLTSHTERRKTLQLLPPLVNQLNHLLLFLIF